MQRTHYDILEIHMQASAAEIKQAYRRQAMKWHPDRKPNNQKLAGERFKEIAEAYKHLADSASRARYDNCLRQRRRGHGWTRSETEPAGAHGFADNAATRQLIDQMLLHAVELTIRRISIFTILLGLNYPAK